MNHTRAYRLPRLCLPRPGIDLRKWAVIACDQHTAEPDYWQRVAAEVGDAPSTLQLIYPEAFLGEADGAARIARIQAAMRAYLAGGLLAEHTGAVYVERRIGARVRRGLMLELDLAHYDFRPGSASLIRPTEQTIVARLAPRIEVRRGAALELPHILVLIDDPGGTVIEPLAAARARFAPLYDTELMLGGGQVAGWAADAAAAQQACAALDLLADPAAFAARHGVAPGTPVMQFAMGDGNHSLATAKAIWESMAATAPADHPCRHALVEVENIHDPALEFEPIHRLLFGLQADPREWLAQAFGARLALTDLPSAPALAAAVRAAAAGEQVAGLIGPGPRCTLLRLADPPSTLAVGSLQPVLDQWLAEGRMREIDYVHGDDTLARLAQQPGCAGVLLPTLDKSALLHMVVREGVLPRKTFSMGEAHEKRYYVEARRLDGGAAP
ncbi:MAG: DUF1015 domain-containing protein [Rubrivivax sp.]|nr:DUF1015 domain-containing protein [Rubrivivax sp.]